MRQRETRAGTRRTLAAVTVSLALTFAGPAAAYPIGETKSSNRFCESGMNTVQISTAGTPHYRVPSGGRVITSWQHSESPTLTSPGSGKLLVLRHVSGTRYRLVAKSAERQFRAGPASFPTRLEVRPGDVLGLRTDAVDVACWFDTGRSADRFGSQGNAFTTCFGYLGPCFPSVTVPAQPEPFVGEARDFSPGGHTSSRVNVAATVEPDADRDTRGDQTQDTDPPPDRIAPVIIDLSLTNRRFRVGGARRRGGAPRGTTFRITLSERGRVRVLIARRKRGRLVGGKCRPPTRRNRGRRRCFRYAAVGGFTRRAVEGANRIRFSGRLRRRSGRVFRLRRGRYRTRVRAYDRAGNRSRAKRVRFRVVRR